MRDLLLTTPQARYQLRVGADAEAWFVLPNEAGEPTDLLPDLLDWVHIGSSAPPVESWTGRGLAGAKDPMAVFSVDLGQDGRLVRFPPDVGQGGPVVGEPLTEPEITALVARGFWESVRVGLNVSRIVESSNPGFGPRHDPPSRRAAVHEQLQPDGTEPATSAATSTDNESRRVGVSMPTAVPTSAGTVRFLPNEDGFAGSGWFTKGSGAASDAPGWTPFRTLWLTTTRGLDGSSSQQLTIETAGTATEVVAIDLPATHVAQFPATGTRETDPATWVPARVADEDEREGEWWRFSTLSSGRTLMTFFKDAVRIGSVELPLDSGGDPLR